MRILTLRNIFKKSFKNWNILWVILKCFCAAFKNKILLSFIQSFFNIYKPLASYKKNQKHLLSKLWEKYKLREREGKIQLILQDPFASTELIHMFRTDSTKKEILSGEHLPRIGSEQFTHYLNKVNWERNKHWWTE